MAVQPFQPQRESSLSKVLKVGGLVAGGLAAGPGVAATLGGAATGAGLGSTVGGLVASNQGQSPDMMGMQRRRTALGEDPLVNLQQAQAALSQLPPQQLPETRRAFEQALALAQRNQQIGRV